MSLRRHSRSCPSVPACPLHSTLPTLHLEAMGPNKSPKKSPRKGSRQLTLADVQPTEAEVADARKVPADSKQKNINMICFRQWLKGNSCTASDSDAALNSSGEERQTYLMKYLVHQMRLKDM